MNLFDNYKQCKVECSYYFWGTVARLYGYRKFLFRHRTDKAFQDWMDFMQMNIMGGEL